MPSMHAPRCTEKPGCNRWEIATETGEPQAPAPIHPHPEAPSGVPPDLIAVSARAELLEQLDHTDVPRVGRRIVISRLRMSLRSLQNERHALAARVGKQPREWLAPDSAFTDQHVPILVGAKAALAVVQMKERRRLAGCSLKLVEHACERRL